MANGYFAVEKLAVGCICYSVYVKSYMLCRICYVVYIISSGYLVTSFCPHLDWRVDIVFVMPGPLVKSLDLAVCVGQLEYRTPRKRKRVGKEGLFIKWGYQVMQE